MAETEPTPRRSLARRVAPVSSSQAAQPQSASSLPTTPELTRQPSPQTPTPVRGSRHRFGRWVRLIVILLAIFLLGGEACLRWYVGLGDPPLFRTDPLMGYCYVSSQTCTRLHHLIHYNAYSMRSDDFPPHKSEIGELRVLLIGDSVINGGAMIDQSDLVSTLLQAYLSDDLHRPVVVGNASAGGWGPPEELGWLKTFGLLDADVVVLVLSSHNYGNAPHWPLPMGPAYDRPVRKPLLAWEDFITRYSFRLGSRPSTEPFVDVTQANQSDINWCLWSIQQMIKISHAGGAKVVVAQHAQRQELGGHWHPGHDYIAAAARAGRADLIIQFEPTFLIVRETGRDPYRYLDPIHPGKVGHQLMADEIRQAVEKVLLAENGHRETNG